MKKRMIKALAAGTCMGVLLFSVENQTVFAEETNSLMMESQTYAAGTIVISSAEDFVACISGDTLYQNYILTNDIDISSYVGSIAGKNLNGTFDGNGHTIYGLQGEQGLFNYVYTAGTVKNLTVDGTLNVNSASFKDVAGICQHNSGTIENCVNSVDINVTGYPNQVGGIASQNAGVITGCKNEGNLTGNLSAVGGIAALNGGILVSDCKNTGNITIRGTGESSYVAGGIIGSEIFYGVAGEEFELKNCTNSGTIQMDKSTPYGGSLGGIVGESNVKRDNTVSKITNCANTGKISGNGQLGGVVGKLAVDGGGGINGVYAPHSGNVIMENCWNAGTIIAQYSEKELMCNVGGICGWIMIGAENSGTIYVKDSCNVGSLYKEAGVERYDDFGGIASLLWNGASEQGITNAYIFIENCKNKGYIDDSVSNKSTHVATTQGTNMAITGCDYNGETYKTDVDGTIHGYYADGSNMINQFVFDGRYTYYFQADGTAMRDRLTYHPDGEHIIYFDSFGHEVFTDFQYCPSVGYTCYFDSQGYIYKDQITFVGDKTYYLNANGKMEDAGWFQFANGRDFGYANADGTLMDDGWGYDPYGRVVFYHWNGMVARGLITDGVWYYSMDMTDGHYLGSFPVN